jgi:hypothetical protein
MTDTSVCVVLTTNKSYFNKFLQTCQQLRTVGNYSGDICLVIGDDLNGDVLLQDPFFIQHNIIIKHFPNIRFPMNFLKVNNQIRGDGRNLTKKFQWHKMHLFNVFFKKWNYIFYLDSGMTIFSDIAPITNQRKKGTLLAHSDAYPTYEWKLHTQFDPSITDYFYKLNKKYNLDIDYFQTTILLYDTNIIEDNTFDILYKLALEYPISKTNEQGIMALYFTNMKPLFEQINVGGEDGSHFYYDYLSRNPAHSYIMLKWVQNRPTH